MCLPGEILGYRISSLTVEPVVAADHPEHLLLEVGLLLFEALTLLRMENYFLKEELVDLLAQADLLVKPFFIPLELLELSYGLDVGDQEPEEGRQLFV